MRVRNLLILFYGFGVLTSQLSAQPAGPALPLDLAFSRRTVRTSDRPVVSRDGKMLAYEIHTPPLLSPETEMIEGSRFLPTGTPPGSVGLRLYVVPTRGGEARSACPEKGNCWRPSFSPDGRKLAFYSDAGGLPQLWVYDVDKSEARRVSDLKIKAKHWPGDEAEWSLDGSEVFVPLAPGALLLAGESKAAPTGATAPSPSGTPSNGPTVTVYKAGTELAPETGTDSPDALQALLISENNATLAAINIATGKVRVIVPDVSEPRPSSMRLSPDGKWVSYLSVFELKDATSTITYYDLAVAPASGGKPTVVAADIEVGDDDYFESTYRWRPGTTQIVFLKQKKLWMADAANPAAAPRQFGAALGNLTDTPILLNSDGSAALVGIAAKGEKTYYSVQPKSLALVPLDGSAPRTFATVGEPIRADRDTLWQTGAERFALVVNDEKTGDRSVVNVDANSGATSVPWKGRGRFDAVGAHGGGVVARYESLDTPPDFYTFAPDFASKRRLSHVEPRLDSVRIGAMEMFESLVPGFDGHLQSVQTAVFLPPGKKVGDRLPTIVHFYAGAKTSDEAQEYGGGAPNSIPVQVFATRGYAVLLVDVPLGPEGKGGNPVQEMSDAILAQVYRAADLGYTDIKRVAIMGQSYGGYGTAAMITQTNLFRAAIAMNGVYDLPGNYAHMYPGGVTVMFNWSETGQGRMGTHPWADMPRYLSNSPYYQADKIHTPLLLIHGKKDDALPATEAEKMFNALKRLNRTAQLAVYDGEGHVPGWWSLVNAVDATQRMLDFLGRHMSSGAAAPGR